MTKVPRLWPRCLLLPLLILAQATPHGSGIQCPGFLDVVSVRPAAFSTNCSGRCLHALAYSASASHTLTLASAEPIDGCPPCPAGTGTFKDSGTFGGSFQHQDSGVPNGMTAVSFVGRQPDEMSDTATIEFKDSYGKTIGTSDFRVWGGRAGEFSGSLWQCETAPAPVCSGSLVARGLVLSTLSDPDITIPPCVLARASNYTFQASGPTEDALGSHTVRLAHAANHAPGCQCSAGMVQPPEPFLPNALEGDFADGESLRVTAVVTPEAHTGFDVVIVRSFKAEGGKSAKLKGTYRLESLVGGGGEGDWRAPLFACPETNTNTKVPTPVWVYVSLTAGILLVFALMTVCGKSMLAREKVNYDDYDSDEEDDFGGMTGYISASEL